MPIHDTYARVTPWELSFPDEAFAVERFRAIEEEAAARGSDLGDPGELVMLMSSGQALRDLRGPEEDPERIQEHGALLYHAYHFWRNDRPLYLLAGATARYLVEEVDGAGGGWRPAVPRAAAYVQLPQHLFWVPGDPGEAPESADGFFWTESRGRLSVMLVMGVREDRPGFSVVPVPPLPLEEAAVWAGAQAREDGPDFASSLPGAELEGLYELRTAGEVLKLVARLLRHMEGTHGPGGPGGGGAARVPEAAGAGAAGAAARGPRPSGLGWVRIELG